jgi:nitrate reductase NapE component
MMIILIQKYLKFFSRNSKTYIQFNKQLLLGELAGLFAGLLAAELVASWAMGSDFAISTTSTAADYAAAIMVFLVIFYYDQKKSLMGFERNTRIKKVLRLALSLWPAVAAADVAFLVARPYIHYEMLQIQVDPIISVTIAHFLAFGLFNLVAIFSRSLMDFRNFQRTRNAGN